LRRHRLSAVRGRSGLVPIRVRRSGIWWLYDSGGYNEEVSYVQPYHLTTKEYDPDSRLYYFL